MKTNKNNPQDIHTTLNLYEASALEFILDRECEIRISNQKAVFCFPRTDELKQALNAFSNAKSTINLQGFITAMKSVKTRMYSQNANNKGGKMTDKLNHLKSNSKGNEKPQSREAACNSNIVTPVTQAETHPTRGGMCRRGRVP
jgi:hypothetical protein